MIKRIIILNSYDYFGGTLVLSTLCRFLIKKGYDARLFIVHDFPTSKINKLKFWYSWLRNICVYNIKKIIYFFAKNTKYAKSTFLNSVALNHTYGCKIQYSPFFNRKNTLVLYPEYLYGNVLGGKSVVRWLLYFYKYSNEKEAYSKDDLFLCYREKFNSYDLNPECKEVKINVFDSKLYYQYNFGDRKEKCYLIRKGRGRKDLPEYFDGEVIDYGTSECEINRIFNEYKYCYIYDTQTFYSVIASVCGCIPIVMVEEGKSRFDYLGENDKIGYGIAYGDNSEEINFAISTRDKLLQSLDYEKNNDLNVEKFISYVEDYFSCKLKKNDVIAKTKNFS